MERSNRNLSLSSPWFLTAVDYVSHCVSGETQSLTFNAHIALLYSWNTAADLPMPPNPPISLPRVDWWATFVFCFSLHLICIFIIIITITIISTCCLRELTSEQYAHVKKKKVYIYISKGTLAFYELMICLLFSTFTELSCKLMLFYVEMHTQTHTRTHPHTTLVMTTLLFLMTKMYFNYI